jgi:ATP-binding cassette, subfamily F, member 3
VKSEQFIEKPVPREKHGINLSGEVHSDKLILEITGCGKKFGTAEVLRNVSFNIHGSEHVWVVGKNGSGKTTLLNIITGKLKPDSGDIKLGSNLKIGYFSQDINLDKESTGIYELRSTEADETTCYLLAAHMHLSQDDLRKKISLLSSGQAAKLAFVKLLLENNQLLILDEPTNHLEIETREQIEEALQGYKGAILVASHDRFFIETIGANKVVEL